MQMQFKSAVILLAASLCTNLFAAEPGPTDKDAPKEFTTTKSGLKYRILRKSKFKKPKPTDWVTVHYKGWLDDDTVFDSTYPKNKVGTFKLTTMVKGWAEGLQLIGEGGMIELEIPPKLGYGNRAQGAIPTNATLHFIVELIKVEK